MSHSPSQPNADAAAALNPAIAETVALARAGRVDEAGAQFFAMYRGSPRLRGCASNALECARHLALNGAPAPVSRVVDGAEAKGVISIIVCSIRPAQLANLHRDLQAHLAGEAWELVHIPDAHSLCEGYTRGMQQARGDLLVFCHDDIGIVCDDFAGRLRRYLARFDVIGVAGSDTLNGPVWAWAGTPHVLNWVCPRKVDGKFYAFLLGPGPLLANAQALDGVFIAARREAAEHIGFDTDTFDGFHFYDLDFSYRAARAGLRCAVAAEIVVWHASGGDFRSPAWQHYATRFVQKFPELEPQTEMAPYESVGLEFEPRLGAAIYNWLTHWALLAASRDDTH
jgi:hypothetical protein